MSIFEKINELLVQKVYASSLGESLEEKLGQLESGGIDNKEDFVGMIIDIAVPLSVTCVVILVIYAGYLLMSSQGNPDKIQEGRDIITNAVIGFLIVLLSVAILLVISNTLEIDIYN